MSSISGRRGAVVQQALLQAALAELSESGYGQLTMEKVAQRAGVHKTTIYRRWSDKEQLLTDAVLGLLLEEFSIPDTGDIDADLRTAIRSRVAWLTGPVGTPLVRMLGSDAGQLPQMRRSINQIMTIRHDMVQARLDGAVVAGQLPAGVDPLHLLSTLVAPVYFALLVTVQPVTQADADRAAAVTLAAARAGLLGQPPA